jgi:hypothetical protein
MSSIVIAGDTSGSVTLQAPAVSGSTVLNLPATSGTIQASGAGYTTNGVAYATSSTGLTTGSALTFDGTTTLTAPSFQATTTTTALVRNVNNSFLGLAGGTSYSNGAALLLTGNTYSAVSQAFIDADVSNFRSAGAVTTYMTLNSTGLGIGTSSPTARFDVRRGDADGLIAEFHQSGGYGIDVGSSQSVAYLSSGYLQVFTFKTDSGSGQVERARITSAGDVGIGTSSPSQKLDVTVSSSTEGSGLAVTNSLTGGYGSGITFYSLRSDTSAKVVAGSIVINGASAWNSNATTSSNMIFSTVGANTLAERARITSGGFFKASTTGAYAGGSSHEFRTGIDGNYSVTVTNTASSPFGFYVGYTAAAPNNTTNRFIDCEDSSALRFQVRSNGGLANFSANNVNLSDRREKTNFAPATSYLDKICAIPVQTFNYIDQNMEEDGGLTLGVVAQDVQAVAPELVLESNWAGKDEEPKMRLSIYQTDLQYALMKCIQEQQALITTLTERITALEGV